MNKGHRYTLEPYRGMNTRHRCPACQQRDKTFSLYIDTETGGHIHPSVGRCNRESKCGYHYTPKQYFIDNGIPFDNQQPKVYKFRTATPQQKPVSFIPVDVFKASLNPAALETNHFVKYLINLFGEDIASDVVSRYFIGTSKHWGGSTVFWQIDILGKIRTGKIMLYSPDTGKRVKLPFNHITWAHTALKQPEFALKQCLYGEHLLKGNRKPVAIVESEKTAVIASVYFPQFICLAAGSLANLNAERCSVLKGRTVVLFPDLNGFDKWSSRAKELSHLATFTVSDLLERKATEAERRQGLDLADYLTRFDFREFTIPEPETEKPAPAIQPLVEVQAIQQPQPVSNISKPEKPKPQNWGQEIAELESYFENITQPYRAYIGLPYRALRLNAHTLIGDIPAFIESHIATLKANNGNRTFLPYLDRLHELKRYFQYSSTG